MLEREIESRHTQGERPRIEVVGVSGSWQNLAMARGLEATNGYNPLRIGSYDRLVSPGETTHIVDQRLFPASFDGYDCALARELGLEYVVLGRPIEEVPHLARRPVSDVLLAGPKVWIYRLRPAPSRASSSSSAWWWRTPTPRSRRDGIPINPAGETAQIDDGTAPAHIYWPASGRPGRAGRASSPGGPDRSRSRSKATSRASLMAARGLLSRLGRRDRRQARAHRCAPMCCSAASR